MRIEWAGSIPIDPTHIKTQLRLPDDVIPENSYIFHIQYTPQGLILPNEMHPDVSTYESEKREVTLLSIPFVGATEADIAKAREGVNVVVSVLWAKCEKDDHPKKNLFDAIRALSTGSHWNAIIPVNVAVELNLSGFISRICEKLGIDKSFDGVLKGHWARLQFVSVLCKLRVIPEPPVELLEGLDGLRQERNKLGHKGHLQVDRTGAARLLAAGILGLCYFEYIETKCFHDEASAT